MSTGGFAFIKIDLLKEQNGITFYDKNKSLLFFPVRNIFQFIQNHINNTNKLSNLMSLNLAKTKNF
ncbi:hypothetical protein EV05_1910 [Prochlorococcus sp. MIT 0601]|nr:hypothetical protein EV05_1910 [Prochlorococcus sp. MIT 0601]